MAERCQDATLSEAEELAFKRKVAAVARQKPKDRQFAAIPYPRFCPLPAVGGGTAPAVGGGAVARMDVKLHLHAYRHHGAGVKL